MRISSGENGAPSVRRLCVYPNPSKVLAGSGSGGRDRTYDQLINSQLKHKLRIKCAKLKGNLVFCRCATSTAKEPSRRFGASAPFLVAQYVTQLSGPQFAPLRMGRRVDGRRRNFFGRGGGRGGTDQKSPPANPERAMIPNQAMKPEPMLITPSGRAMIQIIPITRMITGIAIRTMPETMAAAIRDM